ncbi:MAG: hypothetical protein A2503_01265 [Burkholderiales bacterium RIFOXYD12_FULL_59_19]|nr:MAG: hypothetical protein A2503_01265 [Burkholderiales bacterium RIFOXYD12_FULL_59_19]
MRRLKLSAIVTLGLLSLASAIADDTQAYLHAISKWDSAACYNVMDADRRTLCIAEIKATPALCYSIINFSIRDECRARAKTRK